MDLFSKLTLVDVHENVFRNIVSIKSSQDLFDDLSDSPAAWQLAQKVEDDVKPPLYTSPSPIIYRPFEDAAWFNAIAWPFLHFGKSRYSDGSYGVWYGSDSLETTVYETAYHWFHGFLSDAGFTEEKVVVERKVYTVQCDAALIDLRMRTKQFPALSHRTNYSFTQSVGKRLHDEGHPGLVALSVRFIRGHNYVILNPAVLSNPKAHCQLSYTLENQYISIEQQTGTAWLTIPVEKLV